MYITLPVGYTMQAVCIPVSYTHLDVYKRQVQRAAQFPDGGLERMIDFNPEEQTITIPVSQSVCV